MTENIRYIEDSIHQQRDKVTILRLMCLLSLVKDGLSPDSYESLKTSFLQVNKIPIIHRQRQSLEALTLSKLPTLSEPLQISTILG